MRTGRRRPWARGSWRAGGAEGPKQAEKGIDAQIGANRRPAASTPAPEPLGRGEAQPVLPEHGVEPLEVDPPRDGGDDQVMTIPLVVPQEKVLAVSALEARPGLLGLLNGGAGRMLRAGQ